MDVKEIGILDPAKHWYFVHKLRVVQLMLKLYSHNRERLTDIGAGSGFFSNALGATGKFKEIIQVDSAYAPNEIGTIGYITKSTSLGTHAGDLILLMDVLEHVDDDEGLLLEVIAVAPRGALFVITVPAFNSLWSRHDELLEHRRRYRLKQLVQLCSRCGLSIEDKRYVFAPTFPLVWLRRKTVSRISVASDLKPTSRILNSLILKVLSLELHRVRLWLFGSTALVVARKI